MVVAGIVVLYVVASHVPTTRPGTEVVVLGELLELLEEELEDDDVGVVMVEDTGVLVLLDELGLEEDDDELELLDVLEVVVDGAG